MDAHVTVDDWVRLFRAIGLTDDQMHRWHEEFECRHPEAHEAFLEWLQLPAGEVERIRASSASHAW